MRNQSLQHGFTNTVTSPRRYDRKSADMAVLLHAASTNRLSCFVAGKDMVTVGTAAVKVDSGGYALLAGKNSVSNQADLFFVLSKVNNVNGIFHNTGASNNLLIFQKSFKAFYFWIMKDRIWVFVDSNILRLIKVVQVPDVSC